MISYEEWECGWITDFFCLPRKKAEDLQLSRHRELMGWIFEKSLVDLELDDKCREEVSSLILRCTSLGRAVAVPSQVPVSWLAWSFLLGLLFGVVGVCLIC